MPAMLLPLLLLLLLLSMCLSSGARTAPAAGGDGYSKLSVVEGGFSTDIAKWGKIPQMQQLVSRRRMCIVKVV
jgi:hypothetical protein